jgi:phage terminase large subunit GpA-like protein
LVTKLVKGYRRHEWQKMRDRNEALDCRVYARAAASRLGVDRFQPKHWDELEARLRAASGKKPPAAIDAAPQQQQQPLRQAQAVQTTRPRGRGVRFRMEN